MDYKYYKTEINLGLVDKSKMFQHSSRCNYHDSNETKNDKRFNEWNVFKYKDEDVIQIIERNKGNQQLEISYWVECPYCKNRILLGRIY